MIQNIKVYWAHIYANPKKILEDIRKVIINFIWNGKEDRGRYHLVRWEDIMWPKSNGGWGLKDIHIFGRVLLIKSFWHGMRINGIWREIIQYKYPEAGDLEHMFLNGWDCKRGGSASGNGFRKCWQDIKIFLSWKFGNGAKILIGFWGLCGISPMIRCDYSLIQHLHNKGYFYVSQIMKKVEVIFHTGYLRRIYVCRSLLRCSGRSLRRTLEFMD